MISLIDIGWAAGFLEGEGWFGYEGSLRLGAGQVQRAPLDRLQHLFGGQIRLKKPTGLSKQPIHWWVLDARRSAQVMMTLYPLMSPRRQETIATSLKSWAVARNVKPNGSKVCIRGHLIEGENAAFYGDRKHAQCRKCKNARRQEWRKRTGKK